MLKAACARAARIAVPSAYTKQALIERLGADPEKIAVIPCAIDPIFHPMEKSRAAQIVNTLYGIAEPFLLCVTSAAPHKNLATLLDAHRSLRAKRAGIPRLVLVLPDLAPRMRPGSKLRALIQDSEVCCLHGVTDYGLSALYSAALMTILPSFEEGFGYPVVESMASGTPVVCSSSASLPEVAGGCAELFSPASSHELEDAICRLLDSPTLRSDLAAKGLARVAAFLPSRAAGEYASLVRSIISDGSGAHAQLPALPASLRDR
jgi:alpha-1,3-rhamnosyl/mannosyltransferase